MKILKTSWESRWYIKKNSNCNPNLFERGLELFSRYTISRYRRKINWITKRSDPHVNKEVCHTILWTWLWSIFQSTKLRWSCGKRRNWWNGTIFSRPGFLHRGPARRTRKEVGLNKKRRNKSKRTDGKQGTYSRSSVNFGDAHWRSKNGNPLIIFWTTTTDSWI